MNTLLNPLPGDLLLVLAPHAGGAILWELIARLACRGAVRLLDGGNRFDVYKCNLAVGQALGGRTADLPPVLERIRLSRAFTCYQLLALLKSTPVEPVPTLVLDLLSTFYDENVSAEESLQLLRQCIAQLQRLNRLAPVAASIRPGPPESRPELLNTMLEAANQIWTLEPHIPKPHPRLF
ncbi:MAG: hypothetical protein ACK2UM_18235 [Anaerolineales bacterium]|jgi:hypothetical protein